MTQKTYSFVQWSLFILAISLPMLAWGESLSWQLGSLTGYQWFPLFGLLAWMIMWTHYATGALRLINTDLRASKLYKKMSAGLVLLALLLHPGVLAYMQLRNDRGFPPFSYIDYVGEGLALAVMFGSLSLIIFLSFEIFNRIKDKPFIRKNWLYISLSQSLAMLLIFVHSIRLGSVVGDGWFSVIWYACGLLLLPCFYLIHKADLAKKSTTQE